MSIDFIANSQRYVEARKAASELRLKHAAKVDELRRRLLRLEAIAPSYGPSWVDALLGPIVSGLTARFPTYRFEILGPFGLGAHTPIHMSPIDSDPSAFNTVANITFVPDDLDHGIIKLLDTSCDLGCYAPGTLREMNGLNHPCIPLPETFEGLCEMLERQITDRAAREREKEEV